MDIFEIERIVEPGQEYVEFFREPELSMGVYRLSAGAVDTQTPHTEAEVYYVVSGRGSFQISGDDDRPVQSGSVIFVPANADHHFHSIGEDLTLLVLFTPAETLPA
jgi:mannose-6-phosphate isomerase-like protein (cupin superfamily)